MYAGKFSLDFEFDQIYPYKTDCEKCHFGIKFSKSYPFSTCDFDFNFFLYVFTRVT
jgi:hypothetical protein